jgi:hypothetical protein
MLNEWHILARRRSLVNKIYRLSRGAPPPLHALAGEAGRAPACKVGVLDVSLGPGLKNTVERGFRGPPKPCETSLQQTRA